MKRTLNLPLHIPTLLFSAVIVVLYSLLTNFALAHGGDTSLLHSCVENNNGSIRMILPTGSCNGNETATDWAKGTNLPPVACPGCSFGSNFGSRYSGKDLTNSFFDGAYLGYSDLSGANFTGASLANTSFVSANFSNTNLTNANLYGANLTSATSMDTATLTGVTWGNTTCPDGTNSDGNGNTCVGHLTP